MNTKVQEYNLELRLLVLQSSSYSPQQFTA